MTERGLVPYDRMGYLTPKMQEERTKAATGMGVVNLTHEPKLFTSRESPQEMMKRFLKAYKVGWFYKAGSVISFDLSHLKVSLKNEAGDEVEFPDKAIPFDNLSPIEQCARLLQYPNPKQTWRQFVEKYSIRMDMAGNNLWFLDEMEEEYGTPTAVYNLSPARMWPAIRKEEIVGWVKDWDNRGGGVPFRSDEIVHTKYGNADDDVWGVGVVESVLYEWQVNELIPKHITDVLTLGGRLAGMVSPKDRSLGENEFQETLRAWRTLANSPDAARRLLVFPEPVEWTRGSATPQEIGLPGINEINRTNILSAFPISEFRLGVPQSSGMNSGDTRKHQFREYYEFTIHPRVEVLRESWQSAIVDKFSIRAGEELTLEIKEPNRDDAPHVLEKAAAFRALLNLGFDPESIIPYVGLDNVKWDPVLLEQMIMQAFLGATEATGQAGEPSGIEGLTAPSHNGSTRQSATGSRSTAQQQRNNAGNAQMGKVRLPNPLYAGDVGQRIFINDSNRKDNVTVSQQLTTQRKAAMLGDGKAALPTIERRGKKALRGFFSEQQERIISKVRKTWPAQKAARKAYNDQEWWDAAFEDEELKEAIQEYLENTTVLAMTGVANELDRVIDLNAMDAALNQSIDASVMDLKGVNMTTYDAISDLLQTGASRGYSINQIVDGVPDENFTGLQQLLMQNGEAAWGDARAEAITRTELGRAYNRSNLMGYAAMGVTHVRAKDGDYDLECRTRDGQVFPIAEALGVRDHPNGTLDWIPLPRDYSIYGG
jgi:phage portal protein BeeE